MTETTETKIPDLPEISLLWTRDGDTWVLDVVIADRASDQIDVNQRRYGAEIIVSDR